MSTSKKRRARRSHSRIQASGRSTVALKSGRFAMLLRTRQRHLRGSILSALSATLTPGCWPLELPPCEDPKVLYNKSEQVNGYQQCDDGVIIKTGPAYCSEPNLEVLESYEDHLDPYGYSSPNRYKDLCTRDSDCADQHVCKCGNLGGYCVKSYCDANHECAHGQCRITYPKDSPEGNKVFGCLDPDQDECASSDDCGLGSYCASVITADDQLRWRCYSVELVNTGGLFVTVGRPLMVNQRIIEAKLCTRPGWVDELIEVTELADLEEFSHQQLDDLASHWERIALLEHSSAASFARVILELMALGAPAQLIAETQSALSDEIKHARGALELASSFRGEPLAFDAFPVDQAPLRAHRDEVLISVIQEACLHETLGVIETQAELHQLEAHRGPTRVRDHLRLIIEDESRHTALSWRTLEWLLKGDSPDALEHQRRIDVAVEALTPLIPKILTLTSASDEESSPKFGLLSASDRQEIRRSGLESVIFPCLEVTLGVVPTRRVYRALARTLSISA